MLLFSLPSLLYLIKVAIDSYNMTGLEKRLNTDFQKVTYFVAPIFLFSLLPACLLFFYVVEAITGVSSTVVFISSVILTFTTFLTFITMVTVLGNAISIKFIYFITDLEVDWVIERKINKERYILSNQLTYKIISEEELIKHTIKIKLKKDKDNADYTQKLKKYKIASVISVSLFLVYTIIFIPILHAVKGNDESLSVWWFLFVIGLLVFCVFTLIKFGNYRILKKYKYMT
ncbi:hypothetical protein ACEWES_14155 [Jeotgalibacillus sp. JSM ZJ347]